MTLRSLDELLQAATRAVLSDEDARNPLDLPFRIGSGPIGVLYSGGWTFAIAGEARGARASDEFGEIEYVVTGADQANMRAYEPEPNLVIDFVNLTASAAEVGPYHPQVGDAARAVVADILGISTEDLEPTPSERRVHPVAARSFLERYGPLALNGPWKGQIRLPAESLAEALEAADQDDLERALRISLRMFQEAPQGSLLAVLSMQTAARVFRDRVPKRCPTCGRFFTEAAGDQHLGRKKKWHRRDAVYCSPRCRNLMNQRNSRARAAERRARSSGR